MTQNLIFRTVAQTYKEQLARLMSDVAQLARRAKRHAAQQAE
jgi:hypothetical protein